MSETYGDETFEDDDGTSSLVSLESITEDVVEEDEMIMSYVSSEEDEDIRNAPMLETPVINQVNDLADNLADNANEGEAKDAIDLSESWDTNAQSMSQDKPLDASLSDSARAFGWFS